MTFQPKVWVWMEDGTIYRLIIGIYVSPLPQQKLGVWTVPENQSEAYWPLKNEKLKQTIENCVKDSFYGYSSKCISDSKEMLKWWLMAYKRRKIEEKLKNAWFKWGTGILICHLKLLLNGKSQFKEEKFTCLPGFVPFYHIRCKYN